MLVKSCFFHYYQVQIQPGSSLFLVMSFYKIPGTINTSVVKIKIWQHLANCAGPMSSWFLQLRKSEVQHCEADLSFSPCPIMSSKLVRNLKRSDSTIQPYLKTFSFLIESYIMYNPPNLMFLGLNSYQHNVFIMIGGCGWIGGLICFKWNTSLAMPQFSLFFLSI